MDLFIPMPFDKSVGVCLRKAEVFWKSHDLRYIPWCIRKTSDKGVKYYDFGFHASYDGPYAEAKGWKARSEHSIGDQLTRAISKSYWVGKTEWTKLDPTPQRIVATWGVKHADSPANIQAWVEQRILDLILAKEKTKSLDTVVKAYWTTRRNSAYLEDMLDLGTEKIGKMKKDMREGLASYLNGMRDNPIFGTFAFRQSPTAELDTEFNRFEFMTEPYFPATLEVPGLGKIDATTPEKFGSTKKRISFPKPI